MSKKPDYINAKIKDISKEELLAEINKESKENRLRRAKAWVATQKELHHGSFVCAPAWVHKALSEESK